MNVAPSRRRKQERDAELGEPLYVVGLTRIKLLYLFVQGIIYDTMWTKHLPDQESAIGRLTPRQLPGLI